MHHFSIRDIENLTGIKAHTLRIWEQRYGICKSKRKVSLHRYYDNEDLKQILRIAYLYHKGYRVSNIARLTEEEIRFQTIDGIPENEYENMILHFLEASMEFDEVKFEVLLQNCIHSLGLEQAILQVIYPFMNRIGLLWLTDHVIPAQEHFSTYLILNKVFYETSLIPFQLKFPNRHFLIFSPEGEMHELPLILAHYVCRKRGISSGLLGKNVFLETVQYYCKHREVTHIFVHMTTNLSNMDNAKYLQEISAAFPEKRILAAGKAFQCEEAGILPNITLLKSFDQFCNFDLNLSLPSGNYI
jgi:MerR family transcriptional regulator, light-induced transcriptional regulator